MNRYAIQFGPSRCHGLARGPVHDRHRYGYGAFHQTIHKRKICCRDSSASRDVVCIRLSRADRHYGRGGSPVPAAELRHKHSLQEGSRRFQVEPGALHLSLGALPALRLSLRRQFLLQPAADRVEHLPPVRFQHHEVTVAQYAFILQLEVHGVAAGLLEKSHDGRALRASR